MFLSSCYQFFLNWPHSTSDFCRNKTFHKIHSHALLSIPSKGSNIPSFERNVMKCKSFESARGFDLWERLHKLISQRQIARVKIWQFSSVTCSFVCEILQHDFCRMRWCTKTVDLVSSVFLWISTFYHHVVTIKG